MTQVIGARQSCVGTVGLGRGGVLLDEVGPGGLGRCRAGAFSGLEKFPVNILVEREAAKRPLQTHKKLEPENF